jgi:hypothetical protein
VKFSWSLIDFYHERLAQIQEEPHIFMVLVLGLVFTGSLSVQLCYHEANAATQGEIVKYYHNSPTTVQVLPTTQKDSHEPMW